MYTLPLLMKWSVVDLQAELKKAESTITVHRRRLEHLTEPTRVAQLRATMASVERRAANMRKAIAQKTNTG